MASAASDIAARNLEIVAAAAPHLTESELERVHAALPRVSSPIRLEPLSQALAGAFRVVLPHYPNKRVDLIIDLIERGTFETIKDTPPQFLDVHTRAFISFMADNRGERASYKQHLANAEAQDPATSNARAIELLAMGSIAASLALKNPVVTAQQLRDFAAQNGPLATINAALNPNCPSDLADALMESDLTLSAAEVRSARVSTQFVARKIQAALDNNSTLPRDLLNYAGHSAAPSDLLVSSLNHPKVINNPILLAVILANPALPINIADNFIAHELEDRSEFLRSSPNFQLTQLAGHPALDIATRKEIYALQVTDFPDEVNWPALRVLHLDDQLLRSVVPNGPVTPSDQAIDFRVLDWLASGNKLDAISLMSLTSQPGRLASWAACNGGAIPHVAQTMALTTLKAVALGKNDLPNEADLKGAEWATVLPGLKDIPDSLPRGVATNRELRWGSAVVRVLDSENSYDALTPTAGYYVDIFHEGSMRGEYITAQITTADRNYVGIWRIESREINPHDFFDFTNDHGDPSAYDPRIDLEDPTHAEAIDAFNHATEIWNLSQELSESFER